MMLGYFSIPLEFRTLCLLLLLCSSQVYGTELKLSTDRSFVMAGDTFSLDISLENSQARDLPQATQAFDPSLQVISGPSLNSSTTIINGKRSNMTIWSWEVLAKSPGKFKLPPFELNGLVTTEGEIEVKATDNTPADQSDDIIVKLETDKKTALVGEQIVLSWKVLFKTNIRGNVQPSELPISLESEMLEPLKGKDYVSTINNKAYEVKEFRQAIFATKPGKLTIDPVFFKGSYRPSNAAVRRYQNITLGSKPLELTIKPAPTTQQKKQKKIPITDRLQMTTQWSAPDEPIDVGEPITLEVHMSAPGQLASRLPDIKLPKISGIKIYNDGQESNQDSQWSSGITGYRTQKFAIIPQKPGTFVIPKSTVSWWNNQKNRLESTTIAGRTIQVKDAKGQLVADNSVPIEGIIDPEQEADDIVNDINNDISNELAKQTPDPKESPQESHSLWQHLASIFALLWIITGLFAYRSIHNKRRDKALATHQPATSKTPGQQSQSSDFSRKKVQLDIVPILELHPHDVPADQACMQMVQLLCAWATTESSSSPSNITQLIDLVEDNDPWQPILLECEAFLYDDKTEEWPKKDIRQALLNGLPQLHKPHEEKRATNQNIAPFTP